MPSNGFRKVELNIPFVSIIATDVYGSFVSRNMKLKKTATQPKTNENIRRP